MQVCKSVLLALLLAPMLAFASPVVFVGSDDELNQALVLLDKDEIDSLAVSQRFYVESAKQTKDRIRGLTAGLRSQDRKSVYLYGESLDAGLASAIVGDADWGVCAEGNFAGMLVSGKSFTRETPGVRMRGENSIVSRTCGGGVSGNSEAEFRSLIQSVDRRERARAFRY